MSARATILALGVLLALATARPALSFGIGQLHFGSMGAQGSGAPPAPPSTGKILLVDGSSHLLQTDAASKICIAGGC